MCESDVEVIRRMKFPWDTPSAIQSVASPKTPGLEGRAPQAPQIEKESVEARHRCILEFPLTMSPKEVAKALKAEGCYSQGTTVYYIEYRVRRLREQARRDRAG